MNRLSSASGKSFMAANGSRLFAVEVDASQEGLEELIRIIQDDIMRKYWNEELWNADYRDAFTKQEVKRYSLGEMEQFTEDVGGGEEH
jgi:hypothetical protein